jgi:hypothetical protein
MVSCGGCDDPFLKLLRSQLGHFVIGPPDFEGEDRLGVLPLQENFTAEALAQSRGPLEGGLMGHLVNSCAENASQIVSRHGMRVYWGRGL